MNQWIAAIVASVFAWGAAGAIAQGYKAEPLTAEQKTEIRDRVERLKSERAKMGTATPATPAKATTPARPSKTTQRKAATTTPATPAVTTPTTRPKL
jgi:hypothetical protein